MIPTRSDIANYLKEVKAAIRRGHYRMEFNEKRQDNNRLFKKYVIDETQAKMILLSLKVEDFSEVVDNRHKDYPDEKLYIFGKDVSLVERYSLSEIKKAVSLYIKFNKLECPYVYVFVISFHEQKRALTYPFR